MATATGNYVSDNSSLANFKQWAMAISQALAAFGWIPTADSGQVNWSGIAAVPSNAYVYEVWKANDAQAATLPIFLRIEYGYSATSPRTRVTVGTGSNGAGAITGGVISVAPWEITSLETNQGANTFPCFFSGDAGEFRMYLWQSGTVNCGVVFGIERSKDSTGSKTTDYFTVLSANSSNPSNATFQQSVLSSSLVANRESGIIGLGLTNAPGTGLFNGTVLAAPVFPILGKVGNPMLGFAVCEAADVFDGATITVAAMYGGTHTYVAANRTNFGSGSGTRTANGAVMAILMRYE